MKHKWQIVFDYLMYLIKESKVKPGKPLPSQNQLKTKFKCSDQPIRQAFAKLIELQLVTPMAGKGFLVQEKNQNNVLFSFRELFPQATNHYFGFEEVVVDYLLQKKTGFTLGDELFCYSCERYDEHQNLILFQVSYVPKRLYKKLTLEHLKKYGLMHYIEKESNFILGYATKEISFQVAETDSTIEQYLARVCSLGTIVDKGTLYTIYSEAVEYRESYYNPNFFRWNFIEWRN
ncbi:GntR family trehalose operon transcriptional repressor/GntR family mannosyl-D-glycerate transport/metabolism transcriptional repressor [Entomoplasma freundtii]|uniref:GntR family transcriptional regulator n=1 Tax=Entomoplasma freundtii TaxID=74700 RepID=A0A2K8NQD4_9MOLU|nr:GntR family transcriptional regulator [Entomoplasma freundtii]ATZ16052.1 GntR family transcriptional regulator [Entomoplasma freundtii]TDY58079.1 GntR family trehalose operon transcriptional repressor/GntR family mannosyl-D-glycerate transport/metabolism transcriptional repressor [Entomoplasma freundtii]